jgi:hypothetical protein
MEVVLDEARGDWIAFQGSRDFEGREAPRKKKGKSVRPKIASARSQSWMSQPIDSDASWVALAPPGSTPERKKPTRQQRRPSSPTIALQPINHASRGRTSPRRISPSKKMFSFIPSKDLKKPKVARGRTEGTQGSETSSSTLETAPLRESETSGRGRSPSMARSSSRGSSSRGRSQTRGHATGTSPGKVRASSETRRPSDTSAGRRRSSSQSNRTSEASTKPKRERSTSQTSRKSQSSRSRPPVTGKNIPRPRSTSRTRVTSPTASMAASQTSFHSQPASRRPPPPPPPPPRSPAALRPPPPPSTTRTRREMKGGSTSNSIGPGIETRSVRRSLSVDNRSVDNRSVDNKSVDNKSVDNNIGRKIGFARQRAGSADAPKKSGFMEKLFGNQVDKISPPAASGSATTVRMRPRILLAATIYHNTATNLWITTINTNQRGVAKNPKLANKYLKAFSFSSENEARESAIANAPPKMISFKDCANCFICSGKFAVFRRASHCRNCGVCVCTTCSVTWPSKMIPDTYNLKNEAYVKVCKSCNTLSAVFKQALMAGDYEEAVALHGTGNVNLRTPCPVASKKDEVMHPIHCAVEGGNHDIVRWLIDQHYCPVKLLRTVGNKKVKQSSGVLILTSKGRSVLSIAIDRLKVDILRYLVVECGVSIFEAKDLQTSLRALESALMALPRAVERGVQRTPVAARWDK